MTHQKKRENTDLIAIFEVVEEEVGVGNSEDEVLHLLTQHVQVLPVLHIPEWKMNLRICQ